MSKKGMGLHKAHDHGAGMRQAAEKLMPEIAALGQGAGAGPAMGGAPPAMPPMAAGPQMPMPGGPPQMKKGGAACLKKGGEPKLKLAAGGTAKVRHNVATKSGAPEAPKVKFRGKSGIGSR